MAEARRIAILTGGGDCPGLNAVIRAVTRGALHNGLSIMGVLDGFRGLVEDQFIQLGEGDVSGILHRGGTILGTSNRDNPFRYETRDSSGTVVVTDESGRAVDNLKKWDIDVLVVAGGDGSLSIAHELHELGVSIVGIPKTIDNDVLGTDVTFGFDSALHCATEAIDRLHTTAESHHRIMVLEVMGRNSGWIALMSGMAGGGDIVLIPEIPFTHEAVVDGILDRKAMGKKFSIVVVAEGTALPGGGRVSRPGASGNVILGGVSAVIAGEIEKRTGMETRVTVLGHLQRGGAPSPFDRVLATRFGVRAVEAVVAGDYGCMVALRTPNISLVPLAEAVSEQRRVNPDGETVRYARSVGVRFGDT